MTERVLRSVRRFADAYSRIKIPRAAASLSYFLTMTFFPLLICLYTMLGNSYDKAMRVLRFTEDLMAPETREFIENFLNYVAQNNSTAMMVAGLTVVVTSSSAAARVLQTTIGEMQGGTRFRGLMYFIFSVVFSLMFLAAIYFSIVVMLMGRQATALLNSLLPFVDISASWEYVRFIALGGISFLMIWGMYEVSKRKCDCYHTFPGALVATLALVAVSLFFSYFINASAKYPLVYGSLASMILLMFWIYACSLVILCGALINVTLRDSRRDKKGNAI